jgi:hypothetical protein
MTDIQKNYQEKQKTTIEIYYFNRGLVLKNPTDLNLSAIVPL